ncbi:MULTISPECIES: HP0495 family protein [Arcobacteraceae]|jgi:putative lipoic acid-binding regulatory protein|uniref:DUF493 domain-containing protein n=7 Tax=root TaxID=1 RepID=A8EX05_ALIB4|nr:MULTISPECIES: DUF493 domain-containing protein [Arcobacteraceae]MCP3650278.1 DUF493 domain-containing protein [Arcobacter sp. DNRA7]ABV68478.1 conserved hypothetical protein [Aliarcobacter butzleri RM4018]AGR78468.1 conserved hypothetical protein (DUF493 domain) [Aliarcobacter butzleri 7h1h]EFU69685.1 conserved hypothetical protein [Aliarcobacter butzleri JV22]KLD98562.1 hypothetical protein AF74_02595 [Aliarcobacter butzleri L349]
MIDLNDKKLELDYPCSWEYKLVVLETTNIKQTVKEVIFEREHKVKESKVSSKGKFKSYTLEMLVHNEDDRKEIFKLLGEHSDIKMII